ncbi:hypothetical protein JXR93_06365 [bacterium]|nr:hypothetical protein [bacterium]
MLKGIIFFTKVLLILTLLFTTSCEETIEVTEADLSSFGENHNIGCGDFSIYAFSPNRRYALKIRSNENDFLTENGIEYNISSTKSITVSLMDHREISESMLKRELYCTDIGFMDRDKIVEWSITDGTISFTKTEPTEESNNSYDVTTTIKGISLKIDDLNFQPEDIIIKNINVGWYAGK